MIIVKFPSTTELTKSILITLFHSARSLVRFSSHYYLLTPLIFGLKIKIFEHLMDFNRIGFFPPHRQALSTTLSALYGKILVVMGIAFPMSEVISTHIPHSFYEVMIWNYIFSSHHLHPICVLNIHIWIFRVTTCTYISEVWHFFFTCMQCCSKASLLWHRSTIISVSKSSVKTLTYFDI